MTVLPALARRIPQRAAGLILLSLLRLAACIALLLTGCQRHATPLPNEAYVWQRLWTPALTQAIQASSDIVTTWHVLGAEMDAVGRWADSAPDLAVLAATRQRVVLVLRLDGGADRLDAPLIRARLVDRLAVWGAAGVDVSGVEIDYDCATARLPAYAALLTRLRDGLDLPLAITTLPTWLQSPDLERLLAIPDTSILQVHAVLNPTLGLFNPRRAAVWLDDYARRTRRPWRVALPTYSTRVTWDNEGRIVAIESERPALMPAPHAAELLAQPQTVADFVTSLDLKPPAGLAGIVWFRLPTDTDVRAWSTATWRAVLTRQPLRPELAVTLGGTGPARDLLLANRGNADATLPGIVRIPGDCSAADGINGYALERDTTGLYLRSTQDGLLRAHFQRTIGWLRCDDAYPRILIQP